MHISFLDPYRPQNSPIHSLDARIKFVLAVAFILATSLTPIASWPVYILLFTLLLSVEILSGLGVGYVLKRSLLALPFALAAFPLIFTLEGRALFTLPLGAWELTASLEGVERFASVTVKSWLSVQAAVLLAGSTQFPDLLQAMQAVGIPRLLVAMFALMWRYLFVLVDEAIRLMRARSARSGKSPGKTPRSGGSLAWRARVTGGMAGSLFLRGFERSERIYMAMTARGYDGRVRSLPKPKVKFTAWLILGLGLGILLLLLLISTLFRG